MNAHNRTRLPRLALPFLALVALPAFGCIGAEADIPDIQVTQQGIAFEGAPVAGVEGSVTTSYSQAHTKVDLPAGFEPEVKTLSVTIRAASGVADLSFIQHFRITMAPSDGGAAIELGSYDQAGTAPGKAIALTTLNPANILDAWKTDTAIFTLEVTGMLPTAAWTVDTVIDFAGTAKYSR
jgi:hypothetical protein